ncbi:helix-turn-helix transcriptional regulator [Nocardioides taihuensis]|uniref:AAA family ATPase n=1 Tax=Nocardioides taihuensis TaxID=1835606 RepID=A0ABW0BDY4_9ACTN
MEEPLLLGRDAEREQVRQLLTTARRGVSGTLVISGEPGVGKTALLEDVLADEATDGMLVLRATGLDTERHVPFAGLLQLLRPVLDRLDGLVPAHAAALGGALELSEAAPGSGDRFMIGAAVLGLLSRCAEEGPVVVVVDDLHALDLPSAEALVFAARRLAADPVVVLATARSPEADRLVAGLPVLRLGGLPDDAAASLAARAVGGPLAAGRLEPLLTLASGNPLALLELAGDDLDALATDPADLPARVPDAVTAAFDRRLDQLDEDCRTALLVAAVCGGDLLVTTQACQELGVDVEALAGAEDAGLVAVRAGQVTFRHPLVRAAAYSRVGARERRAAHAAVAGSLPETDADRRAWHLAEAVWRPDAEISDLLAAAGERARGRTAYSVASGAFERSARLHPDPDRRADLLLMAAETAWSAGLTERALGLLDAHARSHPSDAARVRELALRGGIAARTGQLRDAREMLVAAADLSTDPAEECTYLSDAVHASFYLAGVPAALQIARRLETLAPRVTDPKARALGLIATGMARVVSGEAGGAEDLRAAVPLIRSTEALHRDPHRLSCVMLVPLFLRDADQAATLLEYVDHVRSVAGVGALPAVLWHVARDQATTSSWAQAEANYCEAARLAEETGQVTEHVMALAGLCWLEARQGREEVCRSYAEDVLAQLEATHLHLAHAWTRFALGDLELSLGEPARAVEQFRALEAIMRTHELADVDLVPGPELAEALMRLGETQRAAAVAADYARAAEAKGQPWALARAARARGLVTQDLASDGCFETALGLHAATLDRFETARTRLAYGGWLRRSARRVDAREQLRAALDDFEDLGAARWAEHAATELAATGETVHRRGADPRSLLTPQELQVSLLLVEGRTTREAAAALFLSPKTVEYHLRKVYTKLGIGSRAELADVLSG